MDSAVLPRSSLTRRWKSSPSSARRTELAVADAVNTPAVAHHVVALEEVPRAAVEVAASNEAEDRRVRAGALVVDLKLASREEGWAAEPTGEPRAVSAASSMHRLWPWRPPPARAPPPAEEATPSCAPPLAIEAGTAGRPRPCAPPSVGRWSEQDEERGAAKQRNRMRVKGRGCAHVEPNLTCGSHCHVIQNYHQNQRGT